MKKVIISILLVLVYACSDNRKELSDGIERIPVNVDKVAQDASSFLEKIELVPLETNDSSLIFKCNKVIYDKETDMFAIYASDQVVYTFTGDGRYIANSRKMKGQGPKDYVMVLDIGFNSRLGGIDMMNPYGTIYTYSPTTFELLDRRKFQLEFPVDYFMALDSNNYVFNHSDLWTNQELSFINLETKQTINANYEGTISVGNNMSHHCFYHIGDEFYYVPFGLNYYFYRIDKESKRLEPIMYLDMGDAEVKEEGLPGCGHGKRTDSDEEKRRISTDTQKRFQYLRKSEKILPLIKFFNDDYVYVYLTKTNIGYGSHFIYNRKQKKGFLIKEGEPFIMYHCFGIVDNVLLSLCQPEYIDKVVDRNLMSAEEIRKMESLKEDDNPVIIKYCLKR